MGPSVEAMTDVTFTREKVDAIPVIYIAPAAKNDRHQIAVFLPYLGGTKEAVATQLARLAERGFTAISFDPWRLGERGDGDDRAVMNLVFSHFRRNMWPILGQSTLDAMHVLDWACEHFDVRTDNIVAGGLSMGGDISVALAGADHRVTRVAAVVATPDWTRPGMTRVGEPENIIEQGVPNPYGAWFYDHLNPTTHPHNYAHGPAIAFELGADDTHVPPASALAFHNNLKAAAPVAAARMRVTTHQGLDHIGAVRDQAVVEAALNWMSEN